MNALSQYLAGWHVHWGVAACASVLVVACVGGCIPSTQLAEGQIDTMWSLSEDPTPMSTYSQPTFGKQKLPSYWRITQRPSVVWSTVSIVRAFESIKRGDEQADFAISPFHTKQVVAVVADIRATLDNLSELIEASGSDRRLWARKMAETLAGVEGVARMVSLEERSDVGSRAEDASGIAAGPLLQMLAAYINENAGGGLLDDLKSEDIGRLRAVLTQIVLRVGFDLAGRELPEELREATVAMMREADRLESIEQSLNQFLFDSVTAAPRSASQGQLSKLVKVISSWAPRGLRMFQGFLEQWDQMESMELEFRKVNGRSIVAVTITVKPGRQVRLAGAVTAQPALVFRGATRILVIPATEPAAQTVVSFQPIEGGSAELRFEGIIYSLVRLFAFPLADGTLREIRVSGQSRDQGWKLVNIAVVTEVRSDKKDPRRVLVFQDARRKRILRSLFSVESVDEESRQVFNYITPNRRYTYQRTKGPQHRLDLLKGAIPQ